MTGILQTITLPIQRLAFVTSSSSGLANSSAEQLREENNQLRVQLAQMQELKRDNQALHDQFETTTPPSQKLLLADVVGTQQNALIINKGQSDNVHIGSVIVVKNNLIGTVSKVTPHLSLVMLLTDPSTSFTAQAVKTGADGIIRSLNGGTVIFANVVLSDKLENNDIIQTKGDLNSQGQGYPPKLIVGKIVSVDKQASSLFQSAKVESLVDTSHVQMVFVMGE